MERIKAAFSQTTWGSALRLNRKVTRIGVEIKEDF